MVLADDPAAQEAVQAFLSYLLEPDVYGRFLGAEPGLFFPLTQSGLESETLWENPIVATYREYVEEMIAYSEYGALFGFTGGYVCDEIIAVSSQNLLAQTVQQMAGGMSAAEAVAWGQARMEEAVAEFRSDD
jgi:multiple sugar transport system substrate-binding protein